MGLDLVHIVKGGGCCRYLMPRVGLSIVKGGDSTLSLYSEFTSSRRWSAIVKGGPNVVSTILFSIFRPAKWASIVKIWARVGPAIVL